MRDEDIFSEKKITSFNGKVKKTKYLLKEKHQKDVLNTAIKIARKLKRKRGVLKVWLGGSIVKKELGKYLKKWNERSYSDIDFYILTSNTRETNKIGLVKKLHRNKKTGDYYRLSVSDELGNPLRVMDRFSADVWLMSPKSFKQDLRKFPNLLDNTIEI